MRWLTDQKGICLNCSETENDFEINVRKILFSRHASHKGPLKRPQGSWQRESYHQRATPGLTLVPETLQINLQKTQFLSCSKRGHFWGQTLCQACAKWSSYVLPILPHSPRGGGATLPILKVANRVSEREVTSPLPQLRGDEKGIQTRSFSQPRAPRPLQSCISLQQTIDLWTRFTLWMFFLKDINHVNRYCISVLPGLSFS